MVSSGELLSLDKGYRRLLFYSRFVLLYQLAYYREDGVAYRDFKDTKKIGIPQGSLSPNLIWLKKKGYISEKSIKDSNEGAYYITDEGKKAVLSLLTWLEVIVNNLKTVGGYGNEKRAD